MSRYEREHYPEDHTVHMSLDHSDKTQTYNVARCDCGWESRVPWPGHHAEQDAAVEAHWTSVEKAES